MPGKSVKERLEHPSPDARGYTRWWWFGCAVTREEIIRELDFMRDAGIGGVELQILYPVEADDPGRNVKNHFFLSPEYLEYICFAASEAKKRGMKFDFTLGSSWPYGGPFVPVSLSAPNVIPYLFDVEGPCEFSFDFTTVFYGECVGCVIGKMERGEMLPETIRDITEEVKTRYLFEWEWGKKLEKIPIPEGSHKLAVFISNEKRQTVLKPLPGGDGLIIDHNRKDALRFFLEQSADPVADAAGGLIQSYFCDSIEVFGQNWTDIIYEEFRKRRGYELRPYIYALWGRVRGITDLVRYDFQRTLGELTVENFFEELTRWCHEKGAASRIQAHGTWGDILRAYAAADIPEGETFSAFDRYEVNTIHRRLAASAGHLYDKPIVSNESFTWLRFPRFIVTPEHLKAAVDSIFLDGMNQIVNHGYAYSPPEAGVPGWSFYASSQINHTNTWWPYYHYLGSYINRVSDFLRRGRMKIRLAIYLPQADVWAESPLADIHMCMKLEERLTTAAVDRIQKEGFWFDYVNDESLARLSERGYTALLFLGTERIPDRSAEDVRRFAEQGGSVICSGSAPQRSCGLIDYEAKTQEVKRIFREMEAAGQCIVTDGTMESLLEVLHDRVRMDVEISRHRDKIGFVHRKDGDTDIYFLSNISSEWQEERLVFYGQGREAAVFDPMTAEEAALYAVRREEEGTVIELSFRPFQSLLFVFDPKEPAQYRIEKQGRGKEAVLDLSEGWRFAAESCGFHREYGQLISWEQEGSLRYFSGSGVYSRTFSLSSDQIRMLKDRSVFLELEHIGETAAVQVNGREAGVIFMRPYRLDIAKHLREGENEVRITVSNLLINRVLDPELEEREIEGPLIDRWPYNTEKLNQCRRERLFGWRERAMIKEPLPSGIWGSVMLAAEEKAQQGRP